MSIYVERPKPYHTASNVPPNTALNVLDRSCQHEEVNRSSSSLSRANQKDALSCVEHPTQLIGIPPARLGRLLAIWTPAHTRNRVAR